MDAKHIVTEFEYSGKGKKELYSPPGIDIIEIKLEKGFAQSPVEGGSFGSDDWGSGTW